MSIVRLTNDERSFLRALHQDGALKIVHGDDFEVAADLQAKGFVRAVRGEDMTDGAYMVLTGRGVITVESAA